MEFKEELNNFNPWWFGEYKFQYINRPKYLNVLEKEVRKKTITFITGLRRVGKTSLMKMLISNLLKKVEAKHILYLSLDSIMLEKYSTLELVREFRKLQGLKRSEKIYLFFDEAVYREKIHLELKNLFDSENVKIFASSSSSSLLKDKKALLTGRANIVEILPLDFSEFLLFNKIQIKPNEYYLTEKHFEEYMKTGGIPEYVLTTDISYIDNLIDSIIYKDIAYYQGVRDIKSLKDFFRLLMERAGKQISLNKISGVLGISVETAKRYLEYFRSTYLIYTIERCGKLNERLRAPKKIYAADLGIKNYITGFRDKGAQFENLVFLKLKNQNPCYVYKNGNEIDFLVNEKLIEVKYGRELEGKQKTFFEKYPAEEKIIIKDIYDYLNQFTIGYGNYTKEKKKTFDKMSVSEIVKEIKNSGVKAE